MNELMTFTNEKFGQLRTAEIKGAIWFCGTDVAKALGYTNPRDAYKRHCKPKGVVKHYTLTDGGKQEMIYLDEGNMYRLITHSKLKEAERFESWVFDDVLPTIRKTGSYSSLSENLLRLYLYNKYNKCKAEFNMGGTGKCHRDNM